MCGVAMQPGGASAALRTISPTWPVHLQVGVSLHGKQTAVNLELETVSSAGKLQQDTMLRLAAGLTLLVKLEWDGAEALQQFATAHSSLVKLSLGGLDKLGSAVGGDAHNVG